MKSKTAIRNFRNSLAGKHRVQPSSVFPDETIDMLFMLQPKTIEELSGKPQFPAGGARILKYGKAIVDFFNEEGAQLDWEPMNLFGRE